MMLLDPARRGPVENYHLKRKRPAASPSSARQILGDIQSVARIDPRSCAADYTKPFIRALQARSSPRLNKTHLRKRLRLDVRCPSRAARGHLFCSFAFCAMRPPISCVYTFRAFRDSCGALRVIERSLVLVADRNIGGSLLNSLHGLSRRAHVLTSAVP